MVLKVGRSPITSENLQRHNRNLELYARIPRISQELNQSLTSTPLRVTPQMRRKSNTSDINREEQNLINQGLTIRMYIGSQ